MDLRRTDSCKAETSGRRERPGLIFAVGALSVAVLSGCAMAPTTAVESTADAAGELYEGEPATLHATEIPVASAEEARARARQALANRDVDLALYLFVQAVNLDPSDAESLYAIAVIHGERGNTDLALRAYNRVCELVPDNALAQQGMGLALFEARSLDEAETPLRRAVELDPKLWRAHNALGVIADSRGEYDSAVTHYTAAIDIQPAAASILNNRGYSRYLSGDLAAARIDFLAALDVDPDYVRAWRNLGLVLARESNYQRALAAMLKAVPKHVALNDIGYIAMLDGDLQTAESLLEDAVIESPRHYQTAQENLAELRRRRSALLLATEQ